MKQILFPLAAICLLGSCTDQPQPIITAPNKKLVVTVVDYSKSYRNLITLDSINVVSLFSSVAATGGTIAHIGIQDNSNLPIYLTRIEKIDTTNVAEDNIYQQARERNRNTKVLASYSASMTRQVSAFLTETRKFSTSSFTDLRYALSIAQKTVCESLYTLQPYKRYVLVLSDMVHDTPGTNEKLFEPIDMCEATIIIVRPDNAFTANELQHMFYGADVHIFSNLPDAISFIHQH